MKAIEGSCWRSARSRTMVQQFLVAKRFHAPHDPEPLSARVVAQANKVRSKYGPHIGWEKLLKLLLDRECVSYPCELRFDSQPLLPGEFAHALPNGPDPENGYIIFVHPVFANQLSIVPHLVLHQLARVNHGDLICAEDAELFGSLALGISQDAYYEILCGLAEQIGGDELL